MRGGARAAGMAYQSLQNYCADRQAPGSLHLIQLRLEFVVSIDWLLTGEGMPWRDGSAPGPELQ
jgi:hypothetical protein